jgi:hypothetical protein
LKGFAAANGHLGKSDDEIRTQLGDKFPKHIYSVRSPWLCRRTKQKAAKCGGFRFIMIARGSGRLLPPSPPAEQASARQDQAGKASTSDGAGDSFCFRNYCTCNIC